MIKFHEKEFTKLSNILSMPIYDVENLYNMGLLNNRMAKNCWLSRLLKIEESGHVYDTAARCSVIEYYCYTSHRIALPSFGMFLLRVSLILFKTFSSIME